MTDQAVLTATHVAGPLWTIQGQPMVIPAGEDVRDLVGRRLVELAAGDERAVEVRHGGQLVLLQTRPDGTLVPAPGAHTTPDALGWTSPQAPADAGAGEQASVPPLVNAAATAAAAGDDRLWMRLVAEAVDPADWDSFVAGVLMGAPVNTRVARHVGDVAWTVRQALAAAGRGRKGRDEAARCLPAAFAPFLPWLGVEADAGAVARAVKVRRRVAVEQLAAGELLLEVASRAMGEVRS